MSDQQNPQRKSGWLRWWLGPLLATLVMFLPADLLPPHLSPEGQRMAAWMLWIVCWWVFEPIPVAATALLGACGTVVWGILPAKVAFSHFGHPLVFLFFGGFVLARSMAVHGLDQRIALTILTRPLVAGHPWRIIVALIGISAFLSMWISNTATTAMLLPITIGVANVIAPGKHKLHASILLAVAYAASIGGIATPVGSTPNVIARGMLEDLGQESLGFLEWMTIGIPLAVVLIFLLILITRWQLRPLLRDLQTGSSTQTSQDSFLQEQYKKLGNLKRGEWNTLVALTLTVSLWLLPGFLNVIYEAGHPTLKWYKGHFPEAVAAVLGACLLYILPISRERATLTWKESMQIDWASLILFGGGLALGKGMFESGLAQILGQGIVDSFGQYFWLFVFMAILFAIFFTETVSNTATASMLIPLILAASQESSFPPFIPVMGVTFACSLAFMMPVSTPPNAIVFGSGRIELPHMLRKGLVMNMVSLATLMGLMFLLSILRSS